VGRSRGYAALILPAMQEIFPEQMAGVTAEQLYKAINKAEPSLIRIEADELTYANHIMVRYEIEKQLIAGTLAVADVPAEWNRLYKEYLGVDVPNDTKGCLQDSHWSGGSFGYFPSYALGSAYAAQMASVMEEQLGATIDELVARGEMNTITAWLKENIHQENLDYLCYEVEMPLIQVLADMEFTGVSIDTQALRLIAEDLHAKLRILEADIYNLAGELFNIYSPKKVGEFLFDKLQIKAKIKKTKTNKQYSTSEDLLQSIKDRHPIIALLLEYRGIKKLLSTYIEAFPSLINAETGKIHTSFNQTITATGRLSSSNPNLQNIPIRDELGKEMRKVFGVNEGEYFLSADYSQVELRIMAHLAQDENMIEAFRSGQDIHQATAARVFNLPMEAVDADMRRKAKTANFGIIYGISTFGLAERMNVSRNEAKSIIDEYFQKYAAIKAYMDKSIEEAKENLYVETVFHRKRYLPDIVSHNAVVRTYAERNAINAPIQGTAADVIKIAMVNIFKALQKENLQTKMIIQVHDELNFIVPENELEIVKALVQREMEQAVDFSVPLKADIGYGKNWLEAH
ncbi:MAG: DNA polymerase I, partial [Bacteroidales bacterium]|nr:DNA polymerase I [Bacteroidales bacterium]